MRVKMLREIVLALTFAVSSAQAQNLDGPANPPPASFKGQQFVDSRGCLFLRAGFGGQVNWVPRVDRSHKPICGMPPSAAAMAAVEANIATDTPAATAPVVAAPQTHVAAVAPAAPKLRGKGLGFLFGTGQAKPTPAPQPTKLAGVQPQPTASATKPGPAAKPASGYQTAGVATNFDGVTCYPDAPKLERVKIAGGTALVCTRGDRSASGWRPPQVASAGQAQVAAQTAPVMTTQVHISPVAAAPARPAAAVQLAPMQVSVAVQAAPSQPAAPVARSHTLPKPPKGWVYAWKDDRLNPLRGVGTAEGQAQQDMIWTRTVPMVLVADQPVKARAAQPVTRRTQVSSMSAPAVVASAQPVKAAKGGQARLVQIGTFGDPANAQGALARLAALGLPASTAKITRKGKALQIIYAGPFASADQARMGLAKVQGAGFGDAVLR